MFWSNQTPIFDESHDDVIKDSIYNVSEDPIRDDDLKEDCDEDLDTTNWDVHEDDDVTYKPDFEISQTDSVDEKIIFCVSRLSRRNIDIQWLPTCRIETSNTHVGYLDKAFDESYKMNGLGHRTVQIWLMTLWRVYMWWMII